MIGQDKIVHNIASIYCRARLAEVFVERKEHHKGIAATMPNGILGQDFAIQHLQVPGAYFSHLSACLS